MSVVHSPHRFAFRFAARYTRAARPFGIRPDTAWVQIADGTFEARFGPWTLCTGLDNIASWKLTGPYRFWKTAGPAHLGVTDRGLTFATNGDHGLLVCFHRPVKGIEPWGLLTHPELTVTVADPPALANVLGAALRTGS